MASRTQRSKTNSVRPGVGFTMFNDDTVKSTLAGINVDTNGQLQILNAAGTAVSTSTSGGGMTTGALTTGAITASGAITTTQGVASGTARTVGGVIASVQGSAVTTTNAETVSASVTLPANMIGLGTVIDIYARVRATATNSTDTLLPRLRFGTTTLTGTALITSTATDVANDDTQWLQFRLVGLAAAGAAAAVVGSGTYVEPAGTTVKSAKLNTTNFATNGALLIEVTLTWSTNNAGNSAIVECLVVEAVN
jgi:hypothetical protein